MIELETMISLYTGVHIMDANVMKLKDDTNQHICERFHMQEDMDVKSTLTNYSLITSTMCKKMYDYGSLYLRDENLKKFLSFYKTLSDSKK